MQREMERTRLVMPVETEPGSTDSMTMEVSSRRKPEFEPEYDVNNDNDDHSEAGPP